MSRKPIKKWSLEDCRDFWAEVEENEKHRGEQAALAMACEAYGVSYADAEWTEIAEREVDLEDQLP